MGRVLVKPKFGGKGSGVHQINYTNGVQRHRGIFERVSKSVNENHVKCRCGSDKTDNV
jgi:hypothetical protein